MDSRRVFDAATRERMVGEFERSGLSKAAFARRHGINHKTLEGWVSRRRERGKTRERSGERPDVASLVEVEVGTRTGSDREAPDKGMWVEAPGGVRMRVETARHLEWVAQWVGWMKGQGG